MKVLKTTENFCAQDSRRMVGGRDAGCEASHASTAARSLGSSENSLGRVEGTVLARASATQACSVLDIGRTYVTEVRLR